MAETHTLSSRNGAFSAAQEEMDDEEALKWAALERLPTYDRLRKGILKENGDGSEKIHEIDVRKLGYKQRHEFIEKILRVAEGDNERFLLKLRQRIDNVGIELPKIEVRFENLTVDAKVHVGSRALPTLNNFVVNVFETILSRLYLWPSNKTVYNILDNVSGILKSTRMTLLLGPPGSGKSTFLLALAGKLDNSLNVKGRITYNGHELTEFVPQRTSAYISQHDVHIGEMTVRETLDFASRCQGVGRRYELLAELSRREKIAGIKPDPDLDVFLKAVSLEGQDTSLGTDYILKILGLDICADILLGDNMRRGISGGQKKRVTTGEMLVGPAKALFMDEISTGLDSSTTYQIVKCLRQSVHVMDGTMLVSLLQPAPETYELFDDLILLSEGQLVYQGPREQVLEFFENQGFKCPERKAVADFLQEVTSRKDQEQYWAHKNKPYFYVPVKDFADAFKFSRMGMLLSKELSTPYDRRKSHPAALVTRKYALKNWEMFKACFCREWILIKRNSFVYVFRTCQIFFLAAVTMTLFLHTTMHESTIEDGNKYMGALYFGLVSIMFNGFAELALTIFRLPVFYKQRDLLFYPAWAWSLPSIIARIPISLLETGIWVIMTYWTIGFAPETARFFRYFLVLFTCNQMSQALFRFVASLGRSMVVANTFGSFTLLIFFVLGGFILSRGSIPPWWIWGYWISPVMYAQNALAVNEFLAERWNKPFNSQTSLGEMIIRSRDLFSNEYWYWLGVAAQIGFALIFNIGFTLALAYLKPLGETQAIMSKEVLYEKHENRTGENLAVEKLSSTSKSKDRSYQFMRSSKLHDDVAKDPPKRGMILPFQPLAVAFDHINYYVNMPPEMKKQGIAANRLQLLDDVSGAFRPGILTALVGVSGAGKTTLMDVLSGRKTGGYIEGTISISGYQKKQETFARVSGYCEQFDIHSPNVTVWESLYASAWLRLPKEVDTETRQMFVEKVMELVELTQLRNALVGLPAVTGLSTEQRKRLTIAVELVANPSIIFMDEPTSGLDARAAAIVMRTVRNTVDTGRTVVCTIHQPSIDIFEAFDELLLMKQGGQVIYAGPLGRHSQRLIDYFQAIHGVPKIIDGYNPATWMLEVTSQASEAHLSVDFANLYKTSTLYQCNQALIQELCTPAPGFQELTFPTKYSQSFLQQCIACLWKQHWSYWRNPHYCVVRMFFTTVCALMFGTICWNTGSKRSTQQDIFNLIGAMYSAVLFIGVNNSSTVQPVVAIERTVYYRERAAGMYSALPYAFAQVMIELPYILMQTLLYGVIVYFMMNFEWNLGKLAWFFLFTYLCFLYFTFYGMMVVALTPNDQIAAICSATFYGIWNLFAGFLIPRTGIPIWWRWYYWATPVAWTVHGLIASQLGNVETLVEIPGEESKTVKKFLEDYFGFHYDFLGVVVGVHIGLVLLFAFVFAFCIKFLNFQKR